MGGNTVPKYYYYIAFSRFMSVPYRNCELTRKNVRTVNQYELDYAQGWIIYERQSFSDLCRSDGRRPLSGLRYDDDVNGNSGGSRDVSFPYLKYKTDYKMVPSAISSSVSVFDATECAQECDIQRSRSSSSCRAFAFT